MEYQSIGFHYAPVWARKRLCFELGSNHFEQYQIPYQRRYSFEWFDSFEPSSKRSNAME